MKVTSVELQPSGSTNVLTLSFKDHKRQNPFNVKAIDGLDADEILPKFNPGFGSTPTAKYFDLAMPDRNIAMLIELNPKFSVGESFSSLRDQLYKMIAASRTGYVDIRFLNGVSTVAVISGFIVKLESVPFNKDQELKLTVNCEDARLRSPELIHMDLTGFVNATANIADTTSTAPHGFRFEVEFASSVASFTIEDTPSTETLFHVEPADGFLALDKLYFSSEVGNKYLYVISGGVTKHLADAIDPTSVWPMLYPENNYFTFLPADADFLDIAYYTTYWGV